MNVRSNRTPDGVDARNHAMALRDVAAGAPVLTEPELDAFLASPSQ